MVSLQHPHALSASWAVQPRAWPSTPPVSERLRASLLDRTPVAGLAKATCTGATVCVLTRIAKRAAGRRLRRQLRAAKGLWDELDDDDADFLSGGKFKVPSRSKPAAGGKVQALDNFKPGADFATAKRFAETRTFTVAPWSEDVTPKPIFAVSDKTGAVARQLAKTGFTQFGHPELLRLTVLPEVRTEEAVIGAIAQAASMAPSGALAIEKSGALIVYTLASQSLSSFLQNECHQQGVPCIDALDPLYTAMEKSFGVKRTSEESSQHAATSDATVFVVSDTSGNTTFGMVRKALSKFPGCGVERITVCPRVCSLPEIDYIVRQAAGIGSPIVFSFASPGMSRFIRQQCERAKVPYADAFQPVVISMEKYLAYPPVSVPGGFDVEDLDTAALRWEERKA